MTAPADTPPVIVAGARVLIRRVRAAQALLALTVMLATALFVGPETIAVIPLAALAALLLGVSAWLFAGRTVEGRLAVDERGVTLGEGGAAMRFERADIVEGMAIPGASPRVQVTVRGGAVLDVDVASVAEADALLDQLALDPARRALRFAGAALVKQALGLIGGVGVGSYIGFYLGMIIGLFAGTNALMLAAPLAAIFGAMGAVSTRPIELRVGTDGLTLRGAFKTRFVSFADLQGVGENRGDPMLYYRDGHTEVIWNSAVSKQPDLLAALQHRVNGALAAGAEHAGLMARAAVLERRGRPLAQWRDEVTRLVDPTKGYRDIGLSRQETEALLADARSPLEQRIAAAMALRSLDAEEGATRVRVAAEGCASPEMREALERAGDGTIDDSTIDRALAAVERGRGWT